MNAPVLTFAGTTLDEAKAARDAYFEERPDELARFDENPSLTIELVARPPARGRGSL